MAKDKRPKIKRVNEASTQDYWKSLEDVTETDVLDAPESTEKPATTPDYFFRDKGLATGGSTRLAKQEGSRLISNEPEQVERKRTKLAGDDESNFNNWYSTIATKTGIDKNPDNPLHKFDYRGYYQEFVKGKEKEWLGAAEDTLSRNPDAHLFGDFKDADHPTKFKEFMEPGDDTFESALMPDTNKAIKNLDALSGEITDRIFNYDKKDPSQRRELKQLSKLFTTRLEEANQKFAFSESTKQPIGTLAPELDEGGERLLKSVIEESQKPAELFGKELGYSVGEQISMRKAGEYFNEINKPYYKKVPEYIDKTFRHSTQKINDAFNGELDSNLIERAADLGLGIVGTGLNTVMLPMHIVTPASEEIGRQITEVTGNEEVGGFVAKYLPFSVMPNPLAFMAASVGAEVATDEIMSFLEDYRISDKNKERIAEGLGLGTFIATHRLITHGVKNVKGRELLRKEMEKGTKNYTEEGIQYFKDRLNDPATTPNEKQTILNILRKEGVKLEDIDVPAGPTEIRGLLPPAGKKTAEKFEDVVPTQTQPPKTPEAPPARGFDPPQQVGGETSKAVKETLKNKEIVKLQDEGVDIDENIQPGKVFIRDKTVKDDKGAVPVYSVPVEHFTPEKVVDLINRGRKQFAKTEEPTEAAEKDIEGVAPIEKIEPEKVEAAEIPAETEGVEKPVEVKQRVGDIQTIGDKEYEIVRFNEEGVPVFVETIQSANKKAVEKPAGETKAPAIKTAGDLQKAGTIEVRQFVKKEIGNEAFTKLMEDAVKNDTSPVIEGKTQEDMQGYAIDAAVHAKAMELVESKSKVKSQKSKEKPVEGVQGSKFEVKPGKIDLLREKVEAEGLRIDGNKIQKMKDGDWISVTDPKTNFSRVLDTSKLEAEIKRFRKEQDASVKPVKAEAKAEKLAKDVDDRIKWIAENYPDKQTRFRANRLKEGHSDQFVDAALRDYPELKKNTDLLAKGFKSISDVPLAIEVGKNSFADFKEKFGFYFEGDTNKNYFKGTAEEFYNQVKNQTKSEKPDKVQQLKQKIYDNLQYLNDKKMPGSQRNKAKNETKLQTSELLKAGVNAQLKLSGGKWDLMIDGVKQNKRSLGLVEKAEKVELADIEHKEEVKKPFKELPMEIRDRQEIIAETFVEAEDLPSGSGEKVLKQGLADIKQNDGKETSPEAMAVRDAAEIIFNNGKRIIAIAHFPKQELQPEDIWMYVDGQIEEKAIKELNEMEEASEEERISAEAVIKEADDIEKRIDSTDPEERNKAIGEIDQAAENLFGEAEKLGYKKKSVFAEQTSFAELAKAKVPEKGITGEGKSEETTPLFQQEKEVKGQEDLFADEKKDFIDKVKYIIKSMAYGQGTDFERTQYFYDYEYKGKKHSLMSNSKIPEKQIRNKLYDHYVQRNLEINAEKKPAEPVAEQEDVGYGNESEEQLSSDAIEDFGEKIGGARKDTAESGYEMTGKGKEKDQTPGWMKGFRTGLKESGKYEPFLATERGLIQWRSREQYDTEEEAILAIKLFNVAQKYRVSGTGEDYEIYRRVTNRKFVTVKKGFKTRDEANKYLVTHADEFLDYKPQFPERPHIEDLQRTGKEVRKGDVTPQQFRDKFNFKGGEFGNWVPQDERQRILNMAYDGLIDLSDILGVPPEALSLGGNLSIAFGSRGQGLQGAQAHYEPDRAVFNLTRIKGAGSVAHEWFHAFDHYFGFQDRGKKLVKNEKGLVEIEKNKEREYISYGSVRGGRVRPEVAEAFKNVINTIYKQPKIIEVSVERFTKQIEQNTKHLEQSIKQLRDYITQDRSYGLRKKAATPEQLKKYNDLVEKIQKGELGEDAVIKTSQTKWGGMFSEIKTKQVFKDLNDLLKEITGRGHYKYDGGNVKTIADYVTRIATDQAQYEHYVLNNKEQRDTPTKFYYDAKDLDKMRVSDYWSSKHEMAARAFESYIEDQINKSGNLSQYLVHSTENSLYKILFDLSPYPEGVERQRINESFDKLFEQIKHRTSFDENFKKLYTYLQETSNYDINELAAKTGQPAKDIANSLNDLAKRKLVNRVPGGFEPTDEFKILLDDINKNPEKYEDDFGLLYSNPLPAMLRGLGKAQVMIDDMWQKLIGDKIYKGLGSIVNKITPEKIKELLVTNYGLPPLFVLKKRDAFDAFDRYKKLALKIASDLTFRNSETGEKFTEAEQKRMAQVIKGSITLNPILRERTKQVIAETKELERLGKELEVLPIETYNTKLPRKRIQELLAEKAKLELQKAKIIRSLKFEKDLVLSPELADELNATQKKALERATKNVNQKIEDIHNKVHNSYVHGGEGYLKRVYLTKEQARKLAKYGLVKPTRLDLTSAIHRKDIPYEIRKEMGEILTAAYPAAKGIMLEGKDVSFGSFFEVVSENPDWSSETEVQGWTKMPKEPKLGKLSEKYVEPRIAADINDVMRFTSEDEMQNFLKRVNAIWKATKTIMNPSTHMRNIPSNSVMIDYSGTPHTEQARILPEAIKAIQGKGKWGKDFEASHLNNTTFVEQELGIYLEQENINQVGFWQLSIEEKVNALLMKELTIPEKIVKTYGKITLVDTKVGKFMGRVYQMEEVVFKAIKFIHEREKGKTINEAREQAEKWVFNYGEVPKLIRKLRSNPIFGVPFITWSYKAAPRIIEAAITRPLTFWKYPVIFSAITAYALKQLGLDDDDWEKLKADLPERMIKGEWMLLPFRDSKGKIQMLDLTYTLPYKDVYDMTQSSVSLITSGKLNNDDDITDGMLGLFQSPILKTTAELLANKNTYTNQQIWFDIDSPTEKAQKTFDHLYKAFMPPLAPEIPAMTKGGFAYHKMRSVLTGSDDYYGRTFSLAPAVTSSVFGLKTSPIEPEKNIERKEAKLENQLIQLATKENQILRDGSLSEEQRLAKAMDLERDKDDIRKQLAAMEIPVKNEEIAVTEKQIRSLQEKYSKVNLENTKLREQYATEINKLKIKLNSLLSDPDAYTGETKKKEEPKERQKQFNKSTNKSFQKEF